MRNSFTIFSVSRFEKWATSVGVPCRAWIQDYSTQRCALRHQETIDLTQRDHFAWVQDSTTVSKYSQPL